MDPYPLLDIWNGTLLFAAIQGCILALALFTRPAARRGNTLWLGGLVLIFSLVLFDYLGYWLGWHVRFPHFSAHYRWLGLLVGPLFYGYVHYGGTGTRPDRLFLRHLLPAGIVLLCCLPYHGLPAEEKIRVIQGLRYFPGWWGPFEYFWNVALNFATVGQLLFYAAIIQVELPAVTIKKPPIAARFYRLLFGLYLAYVVAFVTYLVMLLSPFYSQRLDYGIALVMSAAVYTLAFLGFRQPRIFETERLSAAFQSSKYRNSILTPAATRSIQEKLERYMPRERPYLDSELRLPTLAGALGISPHHLSQVINERYQCSFNRFINGYRIERARELLREGDLQVSEIAYAVGFNNKTSFYKAFREATRISPTEYRRQAAASDA